MKFKSLILLSLLALPALSQAKATSADVEKEQQLYFYNWK